MAGTDSFGSDKADTTKLNLKMFSLQALFILTCLRGVVVEGSRNESVYSRINDTESLNNATNMPFVVEMNSTRFNKSIEKTKNNEPTKVNHSTLNPPFHNTTSYNATYTSPTQHPDDAASTNKSAMNSVLPIMDDSLYKQNLPFFSKDFVSRLAIWRKILINVSRQCSKLKLDIEKHLEIDFPVFRTEVDREDAFLTFDTVHPVLVRQKSKHDLVKVAYLSILELWPLLMLCFSCAALSGMIVWLLVSTH